MTNKINKKWLKKHKKEIIGWAIALGVGITGIIIGKCVKQGTNTKGSNLWFNYASLKDLKKHREEIGKEFRNAGVNNLSEKEYLKLENKMFKLDNRISTIENTMYKKSHPNATLPTSEHGWYLPSDD